jgi:hypothetical protein
MLFLVRVTSTEYNWVTLAEGRHSLFPDVPFLCFGGIPITITPHICKVKSYPAIRGKVVRDRACGQALIFGFGLFAAQSPHIWFGKRLDFLYLVQNIYSASFPHHHNPSLIVKKW